MTIPSWPWPSAWQPVRTVPERPAEEFFVFRQLRGAGGLPVNVAPHVVQPARLHNIFPQPSRKAVLILSVKRRAVVDEKSRTSPIVQRRKFPAFSQLETLRKVRFQPIGAKGSWVTSGSRASPASSDRRELRNRWPELFKLSPSFSRSESITCLRRQERIKFGQGTATTRFNRFCRLPAQRRLAGIALLRPVCESSQFAIVAGLLIGECLVIAAEYRTSVPNAPFLREGYGWLDLTGCGCPSPA